MVMPQLQDEYREKIRALSKVTSEFKREIENPKVKDPAAPGYMPDMFSIMRKILPGALANRLSRQMNTTNTPAEIFESLIDNSVTALARPQTGTQTKLLSHEPKARPQGVSREEERQGITESIFPDFASASPVAEEKAMLAMRQEFIRSMSQGDVATANQKLAALQEAITAYQQLYKPEISAQGTGDVATPAKTATRDAYSEAVAEIGQLIPGWLSGAEERIKKPPKTKEEAADTAPAAGGKPAAAPSPSAPAKPAKPAKPTIMPKPMAL